MANGIAIKDVTNKLQGLNGEEVIPISTGADEPEVVEVDILKEYINEDVETAIEGKQDAINDLSAIRSGAALGTTALQDLDISDWAKQSSKPSYTASEVGAVPTTRKINNKALSSDITLTATDVNALPSSTVIPAAQIQSDWNQSNTSAKDFIKNKPEIPDVPEWAMSSTKPSYTVSEISGAQEELVSGTNIKTINGTSVLGSGNITIQGGGGGGDVNVIESITFNGSAVPVDGNKNAAITYTETEPDFNGSAAATITSADITAWNGKSTFSGSYNDLTDKPTLFSGAYADLTGKPNFATVATSGDYDDLTNKPTIPTVPSNIVTGTSSSYTIWVGTQAQYDAITTKDVTTIYLITGA